jgi:IS5 family transposase
MSAPEVLFIDYPRVIQAWPKARSRPRRGSQTADPDRRTGVRYKNHIGIDRAFGFLRRYTVTHAAAYDGGQLGAVLDRDNTASAVWADTAYRSAANLALLERRGRRPQFQRKKPRGKPMPAHLIRGNATRAGCARGSSTSSPPRNAGWASSCAPSA